MTRHSLLAGLLSLSLLLAPLVGAPQVPAAAAGLPPPQVVAMPDSLAGAAGADGDWWSAVQADIRQSEYNITWQTIGASGSSPLSFASYQAPNRAHNLRTYFAPAGIRVIPRVYEGDAPPWEWSLTLRGYGYAGDAQPAAEATLVAEGNRIEYRRGDVVEWYVNDARGLEQGFTFNGERATESGEQGAEGTEQIVLALEISGDLTPALVDDGSAVEFITVGGVCVLRYSDLAVYDAAGRALPARLSLFEKDLRITINAAGAVYPITVDPLIGNPAWTAESDQEGAFFGHSVATAGDVNGDGYSDVIVGASHYDNGETDEGRAYVYHGSRTGLSSTAAWIAEGDKASARLGFRVATAGDVNGDGYGDVIVGAYTYENGEVDEGRVFVWHGSADGVNNGVNGTPANAAWAAESNQAGAYFGTHVATAGDVNGDGYSDVIVGALYYDSGQTDEGRAFVWHGSANGVNDDVDGTPGNADWSAEGDQDYAFFGYAVSTAGDVNGDGYSDIIASAYCYDNGQTDEGRAYVYHGSSTGLSTTANWTAEGDQDTAFFGYSVNTAGDVNGDGYADVIVGAEAYDNGETDEGRAYVYHGSSAGLSAAANWTAESNQAGAWFGHSVATAGDVNGDGYADVIVGVHNYDNGQTDEGGAFVYQGSAGGLSPTADWSAESDQDNAYFGVRVSTAGDVNGDGYSDVIVGAYSYDNGQTNEGRAYVYLGAVVGLGTSAAWAADGHQAGAAFSWAVSTAGDVNGDGYSDAIVGAPSYDNGQTDEGRAYVYYGSLGGLNSAPAWLAEGDQDNAGFGIAVGAAGDVNGDGYSDVIVGAHLYDDGQENEGRVYVYHGGPSGLAETAAWTAESDQAGAEFGYAADTAGDVNGDGYSDVIVGALYYDGGQSNEGRVFVFHGSAGGLSAGAAWTSESDQDGANLGIAVSTAGDVNGDGYSDVIVGAYMYDNGQENEGRAYVYHGGPGGLASDEAWTAEGNQAGAIFGGAVGTAGDVNGDGYSDVIVGAQYFANGQANEGRVYVFYGATAGLNGSPAWTGESDLPYAYYGCSVGTAGDANGDGYSDIIIGAYGYMGQLNRGRVYVYHGSAAGPGAAPDWTVEGDQDNAWLGWAVSTAGDVNGDGYSDIIIGAPFYDNGETDEGLAYVYHGAPAGLRAGAAWTAESDQPSANFGWSVGTAGDVNGDGYSDVIVGAPYYDNGQADEGRAFAYHGSVGGLSLTADWSAESDQDNANFGWSVGTAGDVNGDGYSDVIAGAPFYGSTLHEGRAYVYQGSAAGLSATAAWMADGDQANAGFGISAGTAGDVNSDGFSDVIVGAYAYDNGQSDEGRAYVYHGSTGGLGSSAAWAGENDDDFSFFGWSAGTAGDVNGDGYSDVIVGAYAHQGTSGNAVGGAYVYQGSAAGLPATADWIVEGDQSPASNFGRSVSAAGDVNGDGYGDVIVGAPTYDNGQANEGRAYVYHGSATGLAITSTWTAESDQAGAEFGWAVRTAGDVNGDGYSDVIIGAPLYDNGQGEEGRAYVYHGTAAGLSAGAVWTAESDQASAQFGCAVDTAGDVNGDGYGEVIVGAQYSDSGQANEGQAYVYYGNDSDGLHLLPRQLRSDGSTPIGLLGMSDSRTAFQLRLIGRMPVGREAVRLQWQVAPLGVHITATGVISGVTGWFDTLTAGVEITQTVTGLAPGTPYHWRVRLLYEPGNALGQPAGRWVTIPRNGWNEADLRTQPNQPPVADAGPDQNVNTLAAVTLDGSASSDPEGDLPLAYHWTQTGGTAVTLSNPGAVAPTFTAPGDPAVLTFTLAVTDTFGLAGATPDEVVITVNNQPPVGDAGPDQSVNTLAVVALNGSGSADPDGDVPLAYRWTQTSGTAVTLSNPAAANPTFTAPGDPAALTFTLVVTDSLGLADATPDAVVITVNNQPPIANAGPDQSVNTLTVVALNGSGSSDPDGDLPLAYRWTQTGGTAVVLSDPSAVAPSFIAPGDPAVLAFSLVVTDSLGLADMTPDTVVITVNNQPPVANAGSDQSVNTLAVVALDGSASFDPDGDLPLAYRWTQTGGTAVTLSNPNSVAPTFTAPGVDTVLTFTLVVTDSLGLAGATPDTVVVTVHRYQIYLPLVARQTGAQAGAGLVPDAAHPVEGAGARQVLSGLVQIRRGDFWRIWQ